MRRIALAGVAALIAAVALGGAASAAGEGAIRSRASGAVVTPAAWVGGWYGPRWRGGMYFGPRFGFGVYAPLWTPPPVYYAPPPVVVRQGYVQPPANYAPNYGPNYAPNSAPSEDYGYWYYCANPQGYYPYVRQCSGQWQTVPAMPDAGSQ